MLQNSASASIACGTYAPAVRGSRGAVLITMLLALLVLVGVVVMRQNNGFCGQDYVGNEAIYEPPFSCFYPEDAAPPSGS